MQHDITHGPEGTMIVLTLSPDEAKNIHGGLRTTMHTHHEYDEFDHELKDALRGVYGRQYRKGTN